MDEQVAPLTEAGRALLRSDFDTTGWGPRLVRKHVTAAVHAIEAEMREAALRSEPSGLRAALEACAEALHHHPGAGWDETNCEACAARSKARATLTPTRTESEHEDGPDCRKYGAHYHEPSGIRWPEPHPCSSCGRPHAAAPEPAGLDVDRLGFRDLLAIGRALLEHYPPDTIVCSHSTKADIGARTAAAITDLIDSCAARLAATEGGRER